MQVIVLTYHHKYGEDVTVCANEKVADKIAAEIIIENLDIDDEDIEKDIKLAFEKDNYEAVYNLWSEYQQEQNTLCSAGEYIDMTVCDVIE